jgi:hypothetical protein
VAASVVGTGRLLLFYARITPRATSRRAAAMKHTYDYNPLRFDEIENTVGETSHIAPPQLPVNQNAEIGVFRDLFERFTDGNQEFLPQSYALPFIPG